MFFAIARETLSNFPNQIKFGEYVINTDNGWHLTHGSGYSALWKGYCDQGTMENLLEDIYRASTPTFTGNFCVFIFEKSTNKLLIRNDRYRGFPIYFGRQLLTNLIKQDHVIWADSMICLEKDFDLVEQKFDLIGNIEIDPVTESEIINFIIQRLDQRTENFLKHNQLPIRVFLSGGVDSMLVFSFLKKYTNSFQFVKYQHIDYDDFWLINAGTITQNWGYQQIHHWIDSCMLTSGAPGDEFFLRSPTTAGMFCRYHDRDILTELKSDQWKDCLHRDYYYRKKNMKVFETISVDTTQDKKNFFWNLCNINANDWQHWHIGNTLTWTPLRDLEIFKMFLRLPIDSALGQIMDSAISRAIIERNSPGLSDSISSQKNDENSMRNLVNLYKEYPG
jgi:hypothetical protein